MTVVVYKDQHSDNPGQIYRVVSYHQKGLPDHIRDIGELCEEVDMPVDMERYYMSSSMILMERPAMPIIVTKVNLIADGIDEARLTGIPEKAELTFEGQTMELEGGMLVVSSDMPATYAITFKKWPYIDWSIVITVVAP